MDPQYVAGKCNIGARGRTIRVSTGAVLIGLSVLVDATVLQQFSWPIRLALVLLFYIGLLAALEGSMSFCVLHAARGTYDFHEPMGFASKKSQSLAKVVSEELKKLDRRRAMRMHVEAILGALVLALLLAFA